MILFKGKKNTVTLGEDTSHKNVDDSGDSDSATDEEIMGAYGDIASSI